MAFAPRDPVKHIGVWKVLTWHDCWLNPDRTGQASYAKEGPANDRARFLANREEPGSQKRFYVVKVVRSYYKVNPVPTGVTEY